MQNQPAATRPSPAGRPMSAATAPPLGVVEDPRTLFADEDDDLESAAPASDADRFALFPDENCLALPANGAAAGAPFVFEHTTAERAERECRTVTVTPRLILLAVILLGVAFGAVTSCEVVRSATPAVTR